MKNFLRFQTEETLQDSRVCYIDPAQVIGFEEEGDDYTNIYFQSGHFFTVWGKIDIVHATIIGNTNPHG